MCPDPRSHWILVRGLIREAAHWDDFPSAFEAAIPGARVVCLDLPGSGRLWRQPSPSSIAGMVDALQSALDDDAVHRESTASHRAPCFILAISLGGMVAIEWLRRNPQRFAGGVLINTSLRGLSSFHERLNWRSWPYLARILATADARHRERLILALTTSNPAEDQETLLDRRARIYRERPVRGLNLARQLVAAARYRAPLQRPSVPVLLLAGARDRLVDPLCTRKLAAAWDIVPRVHASAGHDLPLDNPVWVIDQVRRWLAESFGEVLGDRF
ncbi:MAG: alpha/beta hydrolase [Methylotetracoccus sp.]